MSYFIKKMRHFSQRKIRKWLIVNKQHKCILCNYTLPIELLEISYIKPYYLLTNLEKNDTHNIEFMCQNCHKYYIIGYIGVFNGVIIKNKKILEYNYTIINKYIDNYNFNNAKYYNYHFSNIFHKK